MISKIIMPQGGQDITIGKVLRWIKSEGDRVKKGEVLCEVETEKLVFDVEAPREGYLLKIITKDGEEVPIFSVIGIMGEKTDSADIPSTALPEGKEPRVVTRSEMAPKSEPSESENESKVNVSPRAKKLALEKGVPLSLVSGTGPGGRITEKDVMTFETSRLKGQEPDHRTGREVLQGRRTAMSKVRKATARKMQKSKQIIPHFYVTVAVDMTEAIRVRSEWNERLQNEQRDTVSLNDLIVRACVLSLEEFPVFNSSVGNEDEIILWDEINIGIAMAVDAGLMVPVLEHADRLTLYDLARQTKHLADLAREGKQATLAPGRFTVSNMGMYHVDNFIAIINHPETAILAISSIAKQVIALDGGLIGIRDMMKITLSVDHRIADGNLASRFINKIKFHIENPKTLL